MVAMVIHGSRPVAGRVSGVAVVSSTAETSDETPVSGGTVGVVVLVSGAGEVVVGSVLTGVGEVTGEVGESLGAGSDGDGAGDVDGSVVAEGDDVGCSVVGLSVGHVVGSSVTGGLHAHGSLLLCCPDQSTCTITQSAVVASW